MVAELVATLLLLVVLGLGLNFFVWSRGFYNLPSYPPLPLPLRQLVAVFAIYVAGIFALPLLFIPFMTSLANALALQFFCSLAIFIGLLIYTRQMPASLLKQKTSSSPLLYDFILGSSTLILAFPIVAAVSQLCDLLLYLIYELESYEQVAVHFLKLSLQSPLSKILALLSIIVLAPMIEEFLFRGTLQSYLKKKLSTKAAIVVAAATFALFHFSTEQGLGNLSLIPSLFTFGCFLGFIYEKQGSLLASIGLHMSFNLLNSLRILSE
jgi:membrane protease YdiL (CAAX protease family)